MSYAQTYTVGSNKDLVRKFAYLLGQINKSKVWEKQNSSGRLNCKQWHVDLQWAPTSMFFSAMSSHWLFYILYIYVEVRSVNEWQRSMQNIPRSKLWHELNYSC